MRDLTKYRLDIAKERLDVAKSMIDTEHYSSSKNRSYYSIFSSVRALLAEREINLKGQVKICFQE